MERLSKQERWILEHAPSGRTWDQKELRELLPASDSRSREVQSASLCRSIARLEKRGLVERYERQRWSKVGIYLFQTVNGVTQRDSVNPRDRQTVGSVSENLDSATSETKQAKGTVFPAPHSGIAETVGSVFEQTREEQ